MEKSASGSTSSRLVCVQPLLAAIVAGLAMSWTCPALAAERVVLCEEFTDRY